MNRHLFFKHSFHQQVTKKAQRKLKAQENPKNVWFGFRMFGMVGWSVITPTLIGIVIGRWIDNNFSNSYSWTLMFLLIGLVLGCFNAWYWVVKESKQ